jgi:hypothetical protein
MNKVFFITILCCISLSAIVNAQETSTKLNFNPEKYTTQTLTFEGKSFTVRAYENIVYVANPVDTAYQKMNIYIPEAYFQGKRMNGFSAETAPIFFPNKVGGYMPAKPASTQNNSFGDRPPLNGGMMPPMNGGLPPMMGGGGVNTVLAALSRGYIVASAGARGRTTKDVNGTFTGKAPAGLVDLKAAIRYLKFNDKKMPGDANKIISNGTSAGGAMSALLGATGNNPDYEPYLKDLGAANGTDDVFGVSAYCPITNLDHADMAYEWQFYGINTYKKGGPMQPVGQGALNLNSQQIAVSEKLKKQFPEYVNGLNLKDKNGNLLTLDSNGNGNFKELVKSYVLASAQKELDKGTDLSSRNFLTIKDGKAVAIDFDAYVKYMERQKTPPAFDALDLSTPENMEFGTAATDKQHFTDFGFTNSLTKGSKANDQIVKMMNPMNYIGQPDTKVSGHWRIRHGSKDKDTGLAVSVLLATLLENKGYAVNLELPWDKPHSGDYDLTELFGWIDAICQ